MEKASSVNFLWFGAQPALFTAAGLGLLVVEVSDSNQLYLWCWSRGWSMGLMPLLFPSVAIFYYLRFHFV